MKNIHDDPCSTDLGIYEAKDLVPNWLASLGTDVFAQRYTLLVVHATIGLDWYRLTQVVLEKKPLIRCSCSSSSSNRKITTDR